MEKEPEILKIGENYESKPDGTLVYKTPILSKDTREVVGIEETAIANHTPILKEQRIVDNCELGHSFRKAQGYVP